MPLSLPASFTSKKANILSSLAVPTQDYDDLSPKGSVDIQIRDLIDEINSQEGWVTTSSCAGRVSVYLDGEKGTQKSSGVQAIGDAGENENENRELSERSEDVSVKAGGKGGGRWLFVSHDPISEAERSSRSYCEMVGMRAYDGREMSMGSDSRLIHFKFEPMILHILTASPSHAQSILSAALQAGFRESGALNIASSSSSTIDTATPMVGIRSMGLSLESIIGVEKDGESTALVPEWQLKALVGISNQRFAENKRRIERFRDLVRAGLEKGESDSVVRRKGQEGEQWEDKDARRARKAEEGKRRAEEIRLAKEHSLVPGPDGIESIDSIGI